MFRNMSTTFGWVLGMLITVTSVFGDNWPQFRGANFDGEAKSEFPMTWSETENVRWQTPIDGEGWSCPIVWGNRVIVTAAVPESPNTTDAAPSQSGRRRRQRRGAPETNYRWDVICLNADNGEVMWRKSPHEGKPRLARHRDNSYATETPATDGERIIAYFGMTGLYCYDMDGNLQWEKDLGNFQMRAGWGTASSPVLFEDKVFLQIDNEEQSFIVALDTKSGDEIWRVDRDEPSQYSSPVIWKNSVRTELVAGGQFCRSYDPDSGKLNWELDMEKGRSSATPLVVGDRLFVGTELRARGGSDDGGGFLFSLRPTQAGISVDWKSPKSGIQMATPVLVNDHLYLFERRSGLLHCIDASDGTKVYRKRVPGARAFWSSPWARDGKVFCLDDSGATHVLAGGPEFEVLASNQTGERTWSSPAIANNALYIRTTNKLYCIAE